MGNRMFDNTRLRERGTLAGQTSCMQVVTVE
jgi:hypothetical protein